MDYNTKDTDVTQNSLSLDNEVEHINNTTNTISKAIPGKQMTAFQQSRQNKNYERIITQESETVKHLYKMLSPKMANFAKAKNEIEPYDDLEALRQKNMGQRLADLRSQIYKNRKQNVDNSPSKNKNNTRRSPAKGKDKTVAI